MNEQYRHFLDKNWIIQTPTTIIGNCIYGCECIVDSYCLLNFGSLGSSLIGSRVAFHSGCKIIGGGNIKIGEDVAIGYNSVIVTGTDNYTKTMFSSTASPDAKRCIERSFVKIGHSVFIEPLVKINPGVTIADGVVVLSGSVVTKDLTKVNGIYAGIPAKFIKDRFGGKKHDK